MALSEVRRPLAFSLEKGPLLTLTAYLGTVVAAESLAATATEADPNPLVWGMTIHVVLLFALLAHGALLAARDDRLSRLLTVFALVPLVRILSLGLPSVGLTNIQWLFLIAIPLLAGALLMMVVLAIPPREAYLRLGSPATLPWQAGVALSGFGLGAVEYFILVEEAWVGAFLLELVLPAAVVIGLASGLAEELIFRGLLQPQAERVLGSGSGLLFVALLFAAMHIGFYEAAQPITALDIPFVFGVGLYFGFVVQRTRSLVGVIFAHGLANVTLYLLMPFVL